MSSLTVEETRRQKAFLQTLAGARQQRIDAGREAPDEFFCPKCFDTIRFYRHLGMCNRCAETGRHPCPLEEVWGK